METGWKLVGSARRRMADLVESLSADQLATRSLCGDWTVHQVAAHLLTFTHLPQKDFGVAMAKARFSYDVAADRIARQLAVDNSAAEIAAKLRERAEKKNFSAAFPPEMTLTDVTVHAQDIRRPLGLGTDVDPHVANTVLHWMTTHKRATAVVPKGRLDGLQVVSSDTEWAYGYGERIEGPAEALMMAIAGRPVYDELTGSGLDELCRMVTP